MIVIQLQKSINTFYKEHLKKLIAIFLSLNVILPITRLTVLKHKPKQKYSRFSKDVNKKSKNWLNFL